MDRDSKKREVNLQEQKNFSYSEILSYIRQIQEDGHVMVIKLDGARSVHMAKYTALIGFPKDPGRYPLRHDANTLKEACLGVIRQYLTERGEVVEP